MIYFIVNPAAGSGRAKTAVSIIERIMRGHGIKSTESTESAEYSLVYTNGPWDYARVSGLIDLTAAKAIVCVGGDGTVQEYVGLAAGRDINFGIIPAGSGNDFLYSLPDGGRKFASFEEKIIFYTEKIIKGEIMRADAVMLKESSGVSGVSGVSGIVSGEKYFFNIGGTGIDIQVLINALPLKKFFGGAAYFLSLIKNAVTYKAEEMTLTIDGKPETGKFLVLAVCNGAYYGGHMKIAPPAVINDGFITLCKVRNMPRPKIMAMFPSVKSGKHARLEEVSFVNCSTVKLEFSGRRTINLDGNLIDFESPLTFEIAKGAVRLIV